MKYSKGNLKIAVEMAFEGALNTEIIKQLGINQDTFYDWMNNRAEFSEGINEARKRKHLENVVKWEKNINKRADGFDYTETKVEVEEIELTPKEKKVFKKITKKKTTKTKKKVLPDVTANLIMLKKHGGYSDEKDSTININLDTNYKEKLKDMFGE